MLARASNKIAFASARGAADAIAAATAKAFAKAEAESCGEGIFDAKVVASSFGEAIVEPYSIVFGAAYAAVAANLPVAKIVLDVSSGVLEASYSDGSTLADVVGKGTSVERLWTLFLISVFFSRRQGRHGERRLHRRGARTVVGGRAATTKVSQRIQSLLSIWNWEKRMHMPCRVRRSSPPQHCSMSLSL